MRKNPLKEEKGRCVLLEGKSTTMGSVTELLEMKVYRIPYGDTEAQVYVCGPPSRQPVILLHGFMQDGRSWKRVAQNLSRDHFLITPDFPGHGATIVPQTPEAFSFESHCMLVDAVIGAYAQGVFSGCSSKNEASKSSYSSNLEYRKMILVGYSMGGRIAATYAVKHPEKIQALVLESAGLGPINEEERTVRVRKNEKLCCRLAKEPFDAFIEFWEQLPLFDSQKCLDKETQAAQHMARLDNDPEQLAFSLRYAGQQEMKNLRNALAQGSLPILYMAGELDVTYTEVARSLLNEAGDTVQISVEIVKGVGHNIHLENPEEYCRCLRRYID